MLQNSLPNGSPDLENNLYDNGYRWLSFHLFFSGSLDSFLSEGLKPFILRRLKTDDIACYFFIRYWEKGPHIRLRIKVKCDYQKKITQQVNDHFQLYFDSVTDIQHNVTSRDSNSYPDRSILRIEYVPETDRYGGGQAIEIAEAHFMYSSNAVLEILGQPNWNYDLAIGTVIQMHTFFAHAMQWSMIEASQFFDFVHKNWFGYVHYPLKKDVSSGEWQLRKDESLCVFEINYNQIKDQLTHTVSSIWSTLDQEANFELECMEEWYSGSKKIREDFHELLLADGITYPKYLSAQSDKMDVPKHWPIFDSYTHMTNNRLGILNRDESFIAYLLSKALKDTARLALSPG